MNELTALFNSIFGERGKAAPMGKALRTGKHARQNRQCEPHGSRAHRAAAELSSDPDYTWRTWRETWLGKSRATGGHAEKPQALHGKFRPTAGAKVPTTHHGENRALVQAAREMGFKGRSFKKAKRFDRALNRALKASAA